MDIYRNETRKNNIKAASVVWHSREVTLIVEKIAKILFILGLVCFGMFVSAETASADRGRIPKEPPIILTHSPEANATQVPVNGVISVVWDRPMQPDTSFTVTGPGGFVVGDFLYDPDTYTVTFFPDGNFAPDTRYGVMVVGQMDMEGQVQQAAYQWNFNTVTPTSVSIVSFGSPEDNPVQNWLWAFWPWLMAAVSIISLAGFLVVWGHRRLKTIL